MAVVELRPEQDEARLKVAAALGRAFAEDPLRVWLLPDEDRRAQVLAWFEGTVVRYCQRYGTVWADDAYRGAACWLPPGATHVSVARALQTGALGMPVALGLRGLRRVLAYHSIALEVHARSAPEPHWYLYLLGVDPSAQGQGLSRRLVGPALARADVDGVPCYLETQQRGNVGLYERFGFAVTAERDVASGLVTIGMRREPGGRR